MSRTDVCLYSLSCMQSCLFLHLIVLLINNFINSSCFTTSLFMFKNFNIITLKHEHSVWAEDLTHFYVNDHMAFYFAKKVQIQLQGLQETIS